MARWWRHLPAQLLTALLIPLLSLICAHPYVTGPPPFVQEQQNHVDHKNHSQEGHVDVIKGIECGPTQIVIITSKEGPADKLRVKIEVTDLHDNRKLPPTDLSGLWLLISRGRYTIPFLKPDRWYGITYHSENIIDNQIIAHTENRLVRTTPRQGNGTDPSSLFEVKMHRSLEGVESLENVYVTARWLGNERINSSELVVQVRVECASTHTNEAIHLGEQDNSVTIEITMDHRYELEEVNKTMHEYKAKITPLQCKRVCWKPSIQAHSEGEDYSYTFPEECKSVHETSGLTFLRNLKEYLIDENGTSGPELVIHTEIGDSHEQAFVTLSALRLDKNDSEVAYRSFSTAQTDGIFRLPLEQNAVYAVSYEYTKSRPFHYSAKEHFVIETPADNLARASHPPLEFVFESGHSHGENKTGPSSPTVVLERGSRYDGKRVTVNMDPMCGSGPHQITLSDKTPHYELNATEILCSQNSHYRFCDHQQNYTKCSPILCYSLAITMDLTPFNSESRCLNVTQHFKLNHSSFPAPLFPIILLIFFAFSH